MRSFLIFGLPAFIALVFSGPVIPYLWKKEKASSVLLSGMLMFVIGLCVFTWFEYMVRDW